ncbi:TMV resistance protein N-like [Prunus avium]|uniref:ADP-ribosyl cyclase/cyclic ADP-ribose hydrolase n=1 Tax=Prunus avium TaxID=42229 RepID=A0A6P5REJ9_PRUAV|nr:TMV resistance protein N-like [Prunus avium]
MGGLGKTTLAKLVFERISHHFELSWFLSNVREVSGKHGGLVALQRRLLSPVLKENVAHVWDEGAGTFFTQKRLCNKKVLLILDDVHQLNQLKTLAGKKDWFGVGSRIIITTRDERLLVEHGITRRYKVEVLKDDEALELFSRNAFKKNQPEEAFLELSKCFVHYAKGLPLALTTLGSFLYARGQDTWKSALDNLGKIHNPTIFHSLKVSYDGLEEIDKKFFLDVACFHKGKGEEQVIEILDSIYNISSRIRIDILIEKSLLTIEKSNIPNSVQMHDLIQEMAWEIVHLESPGDPCQRSRLWLRNDISHVFMHNSETAAIEGIVLRLAESELVDWNCTEAFSKMHQLRLLEFDNVIISSCPKVLPNSLRIIHWNWYPSKSLPQGFQPCFLAKLEMRYSKLFRLWDGEKNFPKLKSMDISYSDNLTNIPNFTRIPNLEELNLEGCKKLGKVHPSIAVHKKLKVLRLRECKSIKSLPSELQMDSLEFLNLSGCSKVKKIPEFGEYMKKLSKLFLDGTAIEQIPSSIDRLVGLVYLSIDYCKSILGLPSAICKLKSLEELSMLGCSKVDKLPGEMECLKLLSLSGTGMREPLVAMKKLKHLTFVGSVAKSSTSRDGIGWGVDRIFGIRKNPDSEPWGLVLSSLNRLGSLTKLDLSDCNIGEGAIPDDIGCLSSLEVLYLSGNNFVSLPSSIRFLSELQYLQLERCKRLEQLPDLPSSEYLLLVDVDDCTSLKRLSDPSKLSEGANVYDFMFTCLNCFRLVEEEGWINRIFAMIMRLAPEVRPLPLCPFSQRYVSWSDFTTTNTSLIIGVHGSGTMKGMDIMKNVHYTFILWPGSEIPEWFNNRSAGDSITVELPLPPQPCSDWIGIALCVVFEDSKYLENPAALVGYDFFKIEFGFTHDTFKVGHLVSQHLWVFYLPRYHIWDASSSHQFSFETHYFLNGSDKELKTSSIIKKCGARLVYKRDLEEFSRILKIPKPAVYEYDDEAGPIDSGSGSSDEEKQAMHWCCTKTFTLSASHHNISFF